MTNFTKTQNDQLAKINVDRKEISEALSGKNALVASTTAAAIESAQFTLALFNELAAIDPNDTICRQTAELLGRFKRYGDSVSAEIKARVTAQHEADAAAAAAAAASEQGAAADSAA